MNSDFGLSRADCISKENYFSNFNIKKIHLNPLSPLFSARKSLNARSTPMQLVYKNEDILLYSFSKFSRVSPLLQGTMDNFLYFTLYFHINWNVL